MFFVFFSLLFNFPQSQYLYNDSYLREYRNLRREGIYDQEKIVSQCFPYQTIEFPKKYKIDSIKINYLFGVNLFTKLINKENIQQIDLPIFLNSSITNNLGFIGKGYFHFGHKGGKTDCDKIIGFIPGFEIPLEIFFIYFHHGRLNLEIGRNKVFWGPGNFNSLFLSNNLSYDMLRLSFHGKKIHFENIISILDSQNKKYMALQRLEILLFNNKFMVGINEAVIWNDRLGEYYLNPISPYYLIQRYEAVHTDNLLAGIDIQLLISNWYRFYIQGVVDDVSFTPTEPPERLGIIIGNDIYNFLNKKNIDLFIEFSSVSAYTYSHYDYRNNIVINGFCREDTSFAHILGNNFFDGKLEIQWNYNNLIFSNIFGYTIQGQYNFDDPWTWEKEPNPTWLDGILERKFYIDIKTFIKFKSFDFFLRGKYEYLKNFQWIENNNKDNYLIEFQMLWVL